MVTTSQIFAPSTEAWDRSTGGGGGSDDDDDVAAIAGGTVGAIAGAGLVAVAAVLYSKRNPKPKKNSIELGEVPGGML